MALAVDQMRADAAYGKQRAPVRGVPGVALFGMLLDHPSDHLEMAELFDRDVLQHVADRRVLGMEGLRPIGERRGQLAGRAAELLEQHLTEERIGILAFDVQHQLFAVEEHRRPQE